MIHERFCAPVNPLLYTLQVRLKTLAKQLIQLMPTQPYLLFDSARNHMEARRGASDTRQEERHFFFPPLASDPAPLAQTLAIAAETFMNHAG